jgi:hypothetical protein
MRSFWFAAAIGLALAACSPAQTTTSAPQGPDAVVMAMYTAASAKIARNQTNDQADVPMTESLAQTFKAAQDKADANQEPFLDGNLVFNCQDCGQIGAVAVTVATPPADGKAVVQARFTVYGEANTVLWDMVQTPQGWRVDNVRTPDGYDLRKAAAEEINQQAASCSEERGAAAAAALVQQCLQVSPATHPPCNAANSCAMIEGEIHRSCDLLTGHKPNFCATPAAAPAP